MLTIAASQDVHQQAQQEARGSQQPGRVGGIIGITVIIIVNLGRWYIIIYDNDENNNSDIMKLGAASNNSDKLIIMKLGAASPEGECSWCRSGRGSVMAWEYGIVLQ